MLKIEQLKVGIAFPAFIGSFRQVFPKIEVVKGNPYNYNLIIFSGGEDISPSIYNNKETYSTGVNVERDRIELEILNTI